MTHAMTRAPWVHTLRLDEHWKSDEASELIASVFVFNTLDALATMSWVQMGLATEANPMMEVLLTAHPALFVASKMALAGLGLALLSRYRDRRLARAGVMAMFSLYTLIICYHIVGGLLSA